MCICAFFKSKISFIHIWIHVWVLSPVLLIEIANFITIPCIFSIIVTLVLLETGDGHTTSTVFLLFSYILANMEFWNKISLLLLLLIFVTQFPFLSFCS